MGRSRILSLGLLLFLLSWLLADHYRPWSSFHSEALSLVALSCLFVGLLTTHRRLSAPPISYWIVGLIPLPWLQLVFGLSPFLGDAVLATVYFLALFMAISYGHTSRQDDAHKSWVGIAHALWIAALVSSVIGLLQWLGLDERLGVFAVQTDTGARAAGNLGQPNQLATLLLLGVAAIVFVYEKRIFGKVTLGIVSTVLSVALVLTQSRVGIVSMLAVAGFLLWKQKSAELRLSRRDIGFWVVGFSLGVVLLPALSEMLLLGGVRSLTATESVSERLLIWKQAVYAIGQAPWFGYGWNQTPAANAVGAFTYPGSTTYTNAHNIVLDLMTWCGIPIGLALTGGMTYWLFSRLRMVQHPDAVLAMAGLIPIAVHSLLEFPFAYAYFLITAGVMIGVIEAAHTAVSQPQLARRWLWAVLILFMGAGSFAIYEYFLIEEDFRIARFENLHVGETPPDYEIPRIRMLTHMGAMLKATRQTIGPNMSKEALDDLAEASERTLYGAIRFRYAQALALNGHQVEATRQMRIIRGMYGEHFYQACKDELSRLGQEKYPQLGFLTLTD